MLVYKFNLWKVHFTKLVLFPKVISSFKKSESHDGQHVLFVTLYFDTIGNMSGTYTIRTDPSILSVQHARRKVPIKY